MLQGAERTGKTDFTRQTKLWQKINRKNDRNIGI